MSDTICGICREDSCDFETRCGHYFHESCLNIHYDTTSSPLKCPYCRSIVSESKKVEKLLKLGLSADFEYFEVEKADIIPFLNAAITEKSLPSKLIIEKCLEKGFGINEKLTDNNTALIHLVAKFGRSDLVEFMISSGADINLLDKRSETPLHYACYNGDLEMVKALISARADLNIPNIHDEITLHIVTAGSGSQNYQLIKVLLENGAKPDALDYGGRSPAIIAVMHQADVKIIDLFVEHELFRRSEELNEIFLLSCRFNDLSYVDYFIEKGADVLYRSKLSGQTGLHVAADFGQIEVLKHLLNCGIDLNVADNDGSTPLIAATESSHFGVVKLLVAHGANLNALNFRMDWTAFQVACLNGNTLIAEFLFDSGADVAIKSKFQQKMLKSLLGMPELLQKVLERTSDLNIPILHVICEVNNYELLVEYIYKGYNIESMNYYGETPLFYAKGHEIIDELLRRSVDLNVRNKVGMTPWLKACEDGNLNLFKKLVESGKIDIHASCNENKNALHYSVTNGQLEMIQILISKGVNVNQIDSNEMSPLNYLLGSYFQCYLKIIEGTNENFLEIISEFKSAGAIFPFVEGYENDLNNPVIKAYMELAKKQ